MREHGGDIGAARAVHGGAAADWIDLSTGINRCPWPAAAALAALPEAAWRDLPGRAASEACAAAAARAYGIAEGAACLPLAGAQAAIQLLPRLGAPGTARILGPTYNEHRAAFAEAGWAAAEVPALADLAGAAAAVVVNPNNPDGRAHAPETLRALAGTVGLLVVDESFADVAPGLSLLPGGVPRNAVVLRSLGKFHGLAGLRLGFAVAAPETAARLAALAGPWAVSGPALAVGAAALSDHGWAAATRARLAREAVRLDAMLAAAGLRPLGGTALFRLCASGRRQAAEVAGALAAAHVWTRRFADAPDWLRLGLPGDAAEWARLAAALKVADPGAGG
ncbi:threonine-phosphate decarboxylase CobD [Paralimibaculum aggregatum]|uniref:threonine-phosphate decarboxylase n=1 Tax=Paralimibaculum aggregatum TaxID=3036245 RepID=A0ABQ6LNP2_9RHOB|nr:threonine-phosphate decarboxylase CobD [Limibaculum sp. NKW23]GMG83949.1 threonine-phosphate decarboxylase CobD [Limibaculum sp. NKW23]